MATTEDATKPDNAAGANEKKDEPEMMRYEDYRGRVQVFKKPPEPKLEDLIDDLKWGSDEEELLPDEEEEEEEDEEEEIQFVRPQPRREVAEGAESEKTISEEEIVELSREQDRRYAEERQRKKLERVKKKEEIIKDRLQNEYEEKWNFPIDLEGWTEEDLGEEWVDPPIGASGSGYDPDLVPAPPDEEMDKVLAEQKKRTRRQKKSYKKYMDKLKAERMKMLENPPDRYDPKLFENRKKEKTPLTKDGYPARPYYVPYRLPYPAIPKIHAEVETPWHVVEELEKIEEFLQWGSYIFPDGSSYEGTLWDDLAHGKGVYTSMYEDVQYEGMWRRNMYEGHGVLHVHVPTYQPPPDSKLEKQMRDQGWIIKADYMSPEDREWLKKDIEDTLEKPDARMNESELYENHPYWLEVYGELPEKGRYKYSGQWKHSRMHGCGVLEVNTRIIYGKFYFGELLPELDECTVDACAVHSGLAQVAAAKARMFTKKPDGMVREMDGPFHDPQHPYFYDEEEAWMAPGWVNAFYEVPAEWKYYVEEVDKEQQMWLNSFIKSPLRIPMPAELEYMWENGDEFVVLTNEPSCYGWLDEENVLKSHPNFGGEILYHVPTGRLINWIYDKDGNIKFFWQPYKEDGSIKPEEAVFLPDGWDEFFSDKPAEDPDEPVELTKEERLKKYKEEDEQFESEWKKEQEELEKQWREEDEEDEEEMKLREQIEDEMIEEEIQALDEIDKAIEEGKRLRKEAKKKGPEKAKEPEEPAKVEEKKETPSPDKSAVEEEEEREVDTKRSFGKIKDVDEQEDDDEDENGEEKPRGFGKVAMLEPESSKQADQIPNSEERASKSSFPTAFAAITMSPWLKSPFPFLKGHRHPGDGNEAEKSISGLPPSSNFAPQRMESVRVGFSTKKNFVRLRAVRSCGATAIAAKNKTIQQRRIANSKDNSWKISEQDVFSIAIPV